MARRRRVPFAAHATQALGKRIANSGQTFRTDAGIVFQAPVVRRDFQFLQRFEAEIVVQPRREYFPDARDRSEDGKRIAFAAQPVEQGKPAVQKNVAIERAILGPMPGISARPSIPSSAKISATDRRQPRSTPAA